MKKFMLRSITISLLAAPLGSTAPAMAMERLDLDIAKPYLIGAGVAAGIGLSAWYFLKPASAPNQITREQLKTELDPLKLEIATLKEKLSEAQLAVVKRLITEKTQEIAQLREPTAAAPTNGHVRTGSLPETDVPSAVPSTPQKVAREDKKLTASPALRLKQPMEEQELTKYQNEVMQFAKKEAISQRIWQLLKEDNNVSKIISEEIKKDEYTNATFFDITLQMTDFIELSITINAEVKSKEIYL